ncbi:hypothetical protein NA56DRAFT_708186 [Hyaloscypha hepaticicola]|uniref:Uncharacterized protein n=1 Tax=Hyaloscypha hepaticicola TaxID=2082293 RepID=A0A2J6PSF5_9HELO|nr:hypothetical protein NA56DRAFT_708186 [Hyaloscypha hepaticicola]
MAVDQARTNSQPIGTERLRGTAELCNSSIKNFRHPLGSQDFRSAHHFRCQETDEGTTESHDHDVVSYEYGHTSMAATPVSQPRLLETNRKFEERTNLKIERRNLGGSAGSSGTTFMAAADFPECGEDTEAHAGRQGRTRDYDKEPKASSERSVREDRSTLTPEVREYATRVGRGEKRRPSQNPNSTVKHDKPRTEIQRLTRRERGKKR